MFLKSKCDTFSSFIFWFNGIRNQFNTRINAIRFDNGLEFNNQKFKQFDTRPIDDEFLECFRKASGKKPHHFLKREFSFAIGIKKLQHI